MVNDSMDQDPALDVTLSDGRQVATFQIAAWRVSARPGQSLNRGCRVA
jgi:hypothetical protein